MKIDFDGRTWQVELEDIGVKQSQVITGYMENPSLVKWAAALANPDDPGWLKSMECLYWLMREQDGDPVGIGVSDFKVLRLSEAWNEASAAETSAKGTTAEEDPTKPAGGSAAAEPGTIPAAFQRG